MHTQTDDHNTKRLHSNTLKKNQSSWSIRSSPVESNSLLNEVTHTVGWQLVFFIHQTGFRRSPKLTPLAHSSFELRELGAWDDTWRGEVIVLDFLTGSSTHSCHSWQTAGKEEYFLWASWERWRILLSKVTNSPLSNLKGIFWAKTLNPSSNQLVRPPGGAALGRSLKKIIFVLSFCHFAFAGTNSNDSRRQLLKYSRHHSFSLDSTHDEAASCPRIQTDGQADMPTAWWSAALRSRSRSHPLDGGRF